MTEQVNLWRDSLKQICKEAKIKLKDIVILGVNRDPFLCGSPKQIQMAEWFKNVIERYYPDTTEVYLRRIHYYISQKVRIPNIDGGGDYRNTYQNWVKFCMASLIARYLDYVSCDIFVDHRNPPSNVYSSYEEHKSFEEVCTYLPEEIVDGIRPEAWNVQATQSYHIEVWVEKSSMNDILIPLCRRYRCVLVTGLGELSLSKVNPELWGRLYEAHKPCRIFYVSDFDPAGERMPRSISRKIEWFNRHHEGGEVDIKLKQIILTEEQVRQYQLPKAPIKAKTERATRVYKSNFESIHGEGAVELDSLESLHPGIFQNIIETEIRKYFDVPKYNEVIRENNQIINHLKDAVREHLKTLVITPYTSTFVFPNADLQVDESDDETWLYDSTLDYSEQLKRYKRFKGKAKGEEAEEER